MADTDPPGRIAPPEIEAPRPDSSRRVSAVWLVPLLALVIALAVAWRTYNERGPLITITFENAAGVEAGQTTLRFRDVNVGLVERVDLGPDLRTVVVTARIRKDVAQYLDDSATFWVVRPSVSAQGVSGIETVISGVYIAAYWDAQPGARVENFTGLPRPPLTPADQPGLRVRLRAPSGGSMTVGAPVLFNRIQVGQVEDIQLTEAGDVMIDLFVNAPNDRRLTGGTRFWNASGFSIELGAGGASLNVESLISLLQGGVSFASVGPDTARVEAGHVFELYPSESAARQNLFEDLPGNRLNLNAIFDGSVAGLAPGATVDYRGIAVGAVTALQAILVPDAEGREEIKLQATLSIVPQRLGALGGGDEAPAEQALGIIAGAVEGQGLRARLASSGLLGQSLHVELAEVPDAPPAALDREAEPYPILPTAPSDVTGIAASAQGLMERITSLPLEQVVQQAVNLLANVNGLVTDPKLREAPENLGALIADARAMLDDSGLKEAPAEIAAILASVRGIVDQATEQQLVARLGEVLDTTKTAVASVGTAVEGVPELLTEIEAVAVQVRSLPLDDLLASAGRVVDGVDELVRSEAVAGIPPEVAASLAELRGIVADLRSGGAVDNVNASLASLRQMTDELARARLAESLQATLAEAQSAATEVSAASKDLPALLDSLTALSDKANALPLDELVTTGTQVLATADGFLGSEGVGDVPPRLAAALEELRAILAELREGGAVANVNATLASADRAADAVTAAAADLPALVARMNEIADEASATLASVGPNSSINRDTQLLLREVRDAARSVNALAQALERQPNSVIFGR